MAYKKIQIKVPSSIFITLNESEEELSKQMKLFTAIKLYQLNKLSI